VLDTGHRARGGDQRLSQARDLALRGVTQLDLEGHVATVDAQILDLLGRHEIAPGVGVGDGFEGVEQGGFGDGHGDFAGLWWRASRAVYPAAQALWARLRR